MEFKKSFYIILLSQFLLGCAHQLELNGAYIPDQKPDTTIPLPARVFISPIVEERVFVGDPITLTGQLATTHTIHLGAILGAVTEECVRRNFSGGVVLVNEVAEFSDYTVTISPNISDFQFGFKQMENLGLWITPMVAIGVDVKATDSGGRTILEKNYQSGEVNGDGYMISTEPDEKINRLIHETIYKLVQQAVDDVKPMLSVVVNYEKSRN